MAFPLDPSECKVIAAKGKTAFRIMKGPGRQNIDVLAAVNACGRALRPLIIFQGKNLQSIWKGHNALPSTTYAVSQWFPKWALPPPKGRWRDLGGR